MKTIKWGIIGTGFIAHQLADALTQTPNCELIAVGSRNQEKANSFKQKYHLKHAYNSYEKLVEDEEIDVVYIATPHRYHKENMLLCINHNKSVLCEKPFTVNARDAEEVMAKASEKGVFVMEAMWTKFIPTIKKALKWIQEGVIGEVRMLQADFSFQVEFNPENRLFKKELAGGSLLDVGIYPITLMTMVYGTKPTSILSTVEMGKSGVDEQASYLFDYGNGRQAVLTSGISLNIPCQADIIGTKGRIVLPSFFNAKEAFLYIDDQCQGHVQEEFQVNGYEYEINEVNDCIRAGRMESAVNPVNDTIDTLKILDKIREDWNLIYPFE